MVKRLIYTLYILTVLLCISYKVILQFYSPTTLYKEIDGILNEGPQTLEDLHDIFEIMTALIPLFQ